MRYQRNDADIIMIMASAFCMSRLIPTRLTLRSLAIVCTLSGMIVGGAHAVWPSTLLVAQTLSGVVPLDSNTLFAAQISGYQSFFVYLAVGLMKTGLQEGFIVYIVNALVGGTTFLAIGLISYALTTNWYVSLATPLFVSLLFGPHRMGPVYPIHLYNSTHIDGMFGLSFALLCIGLLANNKQRLGVVALAIAPIFHLVIGMWTLAVYAGLTVLRYKRGNTNGVRPIYWSTIALVGNVAVFYYLSAGSVAHHILQNGDVTHALVLHVISYLDGHRGSYHVDNKSITTLAITLVLVLIRYRATVSIGSETRDIALLLFTTFAAAGALTALIDFFVPGHVPLLFSQIMPGRFINLPIVFSVIILMALLIDPNTSTIYRWIVGFTALFWNYDLLQYVLIDRFFIVHLISFNHFFENVTGYYLPFDVGWYRETYIILIGIGVGLVGLAMSALVQLSFYLRIIIVGCVAIPLMFVIFAHHRPPTSLPNVTDLHGFLLRVGFVSGLLVIYTITLACVARLVGKAERTMVSSFWRESIVRPMVSSASWAWPIFCLFLLGLILRGSAFESEIAYWKNNNFFRTVSMDDGPVFVNRYDAGFSESRRTPVITPAVDDIPYKPALALWIHEVYLDVYNVDLKSTRKLYSSGNEGQLSWNNRSYHEWVGLAIKYGAWDILCRGSEGCRLDLPIVARAKINGILYSYYTIRRGVR